MPSQSHRVLVVDDEPHLRRVLIRVLEGEGFSCREASSGAEAVAALEDEAFSLVMSDIRMPHMDGIALLREIGERWPDTGVIVVTAVAQVESAVACLQLGALDYVAKPFHLDEVRARVRQGLEKRRLILENRDYQAHLEERVREQAQRIEDLFLGSAQSLVHALEAKDAYLRGHSLRVAEYAVGTARELGLGEASDTVLLGSHLHDIGKIGVREEVLHKAGPLTGDEYRHIMEHPVIGARILGSLFPPGSAEVAIVRSHHERIDGRGLPDGLAGDEIPIEVRTVAVADAFDAMTSRRPYRPPLSVERALQQLRDNRGIQFDGAVVDAFVRAFSGVVALPIPTPDYRSLAGRAAVDQLPPV